MPDKLVTLYKGNKLDAAFEVDPAKLTDQFIEAIESDEYERSGRLNIEFEFRWWLGGPEDKNGLYASWDEADSPALFEPLIARINGDAAYRQRVLDAIHGREGT